MMINDTTIAVAGITIVCICLCMITGLAYGFPLYERYIAPYKEFVHARTYVPDDLLKEARKWGISRIELVPPGLEVLKCKMRCFHDNGNTSFTTIKAVNNESLMRIELTDEGVKVFAYLHPMTVSQGIAFRKSIIDNIKAAIECCARRKEDEDFQMTGKLPYVPNSN